MEVLPQNVILEFKPDNLEAVRKIHGFQKQDNVIKIVDTLEEWVKNQKHFVKKDFSRHYLETTIIASKGSLERAQKKLENVCRLRTQHPQFFGNFHSQNDFQEFRGILSYAILPKLTKDYNRILIIKNTAKKLQPNFMLQFSRILIMVFEYLKVHDYSDGIVAVADLTEVSLVEIMRRINLQDLRQVATILIEGYGVRVKGLHVVSRSKIINALVWILKQVLSAKLVSRIHVHQSIGAIHNFISEDILPIDYGGKEKPFKTINEDWMAELSSEEFRSYLTEMTEARTDESLVKSNDMTN